MYTMFLADLHAEEYEAFRSIPTIGLPDTFERWRQQRREHAAQIKGGGNNASWEEVHPDEFAGFLHLHGMTGKVDITALDHCAAEKAAGQRQRK